jgi:hypothetical protein
LTAKKPLKDPKIPSNLGPERNTLTRKTQNWRESWLNMRRQRRQKRPPKDLLRNPQTS